MAKILITGAAGFIGYHLSKKLLEEGNMEIVGLDNLNAYYDVDLKLARLEKLKPFKKFTFVKTDISDPGFVNLVDQMKVDIIVHLAAQAGVRYSLKDPDSYITSNIIGFYNVVKCSLNTGSRTLIYASSSSVYGNSSRAPFSETEACATPESLYAATKRSNELMAHSFFKTHSLSSIGFRFFTVYGPFGRPDMAYFQFTDKILRNEAISVFNHGDLKRDFTYIDDIIDALKLSVYKVLDQNKPEPYSRIYNIGNNNPVGLMEFIKILEKLLNKTAIMEFLPMQTGDVYETSADISSINRDFNFKPSVSLLSGLTSFVEWYKSYYKIK